jgi:RES domain-containing protein
MKVYRVERAKYLKMTLSGHGAAMTKGFRWNSLNTRLVYTSDSRALATLEVTAHLDMAEDLPSDRYYVEIEIPEDIKILEIRKTDLPRNWDAKPPTYETQVIGDNFALDLKAAVLKVPSAIVPFEFNYLINPLHPDAKRIKVVSKSPMKFDRRLIH